MQTILIIEDDASLGQGIRLALQSEQQKITLCRNLKEADEHLSQSRFDLLILDVGLPDGSGLELLTRLRRDKGSDLPIILLTAHDLETDIVTGLELGADDYVTKPFSLAVLRARVRTQLRRAESAHRSRLIIDSFLFDFERMEFYKSGIPILLSKTEQKLLRVLVENRGITLGRERLIDVVWTNGSEYVDENALSVTVKRLRDKLEDIPSNPRYLKTVYGIGYIWDSKPGKT